MLLAVYVTASVTGLTVHASESLLTDCLFVALLALLALLAHSERRQDVQ